MFSTFRLCTYTWVHIYVVYVGILIYIYIHHFRLKSNLIIFVLKTINKFILYIHKSVKQISRISSQDSLITETDNDEFIIDENERKIPANQWNNNTLISTV